MFYRTDDPIADFNRYDREQARERRKLPRCRDCGEHITDDYAYFIGDEWICDNCMNEYRKYVEEE